MIGVCTLDLRWRIRAAVSEAVHSRHINIEQDNGKIPFENQPNGLVARVRLYDRLLQITQRRLEREQLVGRVIHEQNLNGFLVGFHSGGIMLEVKCGTVGEIALESKTAGTVPVWRTRRRGAPTLRFGWRNHARLRQRGERKWLRAGFSLGCVHQRWSQTRRTDSRCWVSTGFAI
jgi:hypothetical protein